MPFDFIDDDFAVLDRSTLEQYATCPAQARLAETVQHSMPAIAEAGEEIHQAISRTVTTYIESSGCLSQHDVRNELETELLQSRTDLQPDVIAGMKKATWKFSEHLTGIHFTNILRYDGGEGVLSGQLSWDFDHLKIRVTSEIDFLHATDSPSLLSEIDWKTGWKKFTEKDVRESFQFQLHAFLILMNYPDVEAVRISAWSTRHNLISWAVEFRRGELEAIRVRILGTAGNWHQYHQRSVNETPAWPVQEKCRICDYAMHCPAADADIVDVQTDPQAFVTKMIVQKKKLGDMQDLAKTYVKLHGDIVTEKGDCFGFDKPKATKKIASFYRLKEEKEETDTVAT